MNESEIREMSPEDLLPVYELICELEESRLDAEAFREIFMLNLGNPFYRYYVSVSKGRLTGMISLHSQLLLHHASRVGEIQELIITSDQRGHGIGEALLEKAMAYAAEQQWLQVEVSSNKKRSGAHRFYLKNGFAQDHLKFVRKTDSTL